MQDNAFDIAVIGAGIAGASAAAELSRHSRVLLLEMERQPGYHTTGRSAAVYAPSYGPAPIRALTRASRQFFDAPPQGFADAPLLSPIDAVFLARADQMDGLKAMKAELGDVPGIQQVDAPWLNERIGLLQPGYAAGALRDTGMAEIDVAALHQGFLRGFKAQGGDLLTGAEVTGLTRDADQWRIETAGGTVRATTIVNAAGAWADQIGAMAGAEMIGLKPLRRTALMVEGPQGFKVDDLPLIIDIDEEFYLKPDAGKLLISPANENPDVPSDVQPDEMDVAICVHRIEQAFQLEVRRIDSRWAGLRSFVADKAPVAGYSDTVEGFYWLAGQGGYGIQSSPALARFAVADILGRAIPDDIMAAGLDPAALSPARPTLVAS
ncbi:FAD-binding oxidoreductase [Tropicibacter sp. Alg240-R139]|uniref:NAD(P)/FAD-dependent oxidoreductase n=1 Tax=Tropicibacter sp. Alg240-R139 TaxID=2305991 RepID=UPI0013DE9021|nr:FAD-binding oxidoreductase [Tropicibacter sp. Alg240-R139]